MEPLEEKLDKAERLLEKYREAATGSWYSDKDDEKYIQRIKDLTKKKYYYETITEGMNLGRENEEIRMLKQENKRLWHLVRSLAGDETLEKELVEHTGAQPQRIVYSPFNQSTI